MKQYINDHPKGNTIEYFNHEKNIGMQANGLFAFNKCSGKYIAICEGDDYWTDPNKLQKQVDLLESDPSIAISYHSVNYFADDGMTAPEIEDKVETEKFYTILDLAKKNFISTPSVMYRAGDKNDRMLEILKISPAGDYVLNMFYALYGRIHYMPERMATYRLHQHSVWSSQSWLSNLEKMRKVLELMLPEFTGKIREELEIQFIKRNYWIFNEYIYEWKSRDENRAGLDLKQFDSNFNSVVKEVILPDIIEHRHLKRYILKYGIKIAFDHLIVQLKIKIHAMLTSGFRIITKRPNKIP